MAITGSVILLEVGCEVVVANSSESSSVVDSNSPAVDVSEHIVVDWSTSTVVVLEVFVAVVDVSTSLVVGSSKKVVLDSSSPTAVLLCEGFGVNLADSVLVDSASVDVVDCIASALDC